MSKPTWIPIVFWCAALYDGLLGLAFLFLPGRLFAMLEVTPPNHMGYVQFPAALLLVFAAMFVRIAQQPARHRSLIPYGIGLKLSYVLVAGWYWITTDIPWIWKPFAVADLLFALLFVGAHRALAGAGSPPAQSM